MEHEVAAQLGEPVTSSVKLMPSGALKSGRKSMRFGGSGAAAKAMFSDPTLLASTPTRLTLFKLKPGGLKDSLGDQVFAVPHADVQAFEIGKAGFGMGAVGITLRDGQRFDFEFSKVIGKKVREIAQQVGHG